MTTLQWFLRGRVERSVAKLKALREATGEGLFDCKKALEETGWDLELAYSKLRPSVVVMHGEEEGPNISNGPQPEGLSR